MRRLSELLRPARHTPRTLGPADRDVAIHWMAQHAAASAFLYGWIEQFGMPSQGKNAFFEIYVFGDYGTWDCMALVVNGALVSAVKGTETHGQILAEYLHARHYQLLTVVGPDAMIRAFVEHFCPPDFAPRVDQAQCIMERTHDLPLPTTLHFPPRLVRLATETDAPHVIQSSLDMHAEEVQQPNSQSDIRALRRSALQKIHTRRVWVHTDADGGLLFKASRSLPTPHIVQVEGVWTHPAARGQGIAHDCLTQIFSALHERYPKISLTVGRENLPAIALYEKLGMERTHDWRTVYLDPPDDASADDATV